MAPALARTLDQRAAAVRSADEAAFLAGVARGDASFVADQTTYLANLDQLPLARFGYSLEPTSVVRSGRGYWATVEVTMQLDGYDARPVVTPDRYLFTPQGKGRYAVASVTDQAWESDNELDPQPWDLGPITVRTGRGVLGVFDAGSEASADAVVAEVEEGVSAVAAEIPYEWDDGVVLYALDDPAFLSALDNVPGSDPLSLDAVSFEVMARPDARQVASTRFVLNPTCSIETGSTAPGRAADGSSGTSSPTSPSGSRADDVPTWLSEGLAEYVSVRPMAPEDRAISGAALAAAKAGLSALPTDEDFGGPDVGGRLRDRLVGLRVPRLDLHRVDPVDPPGRHGGGAPRRRTPGPGRHGRGAAGPTGRETDARHLPARAGAPAETVEVPLGVTLEVAPEVD